MVKSKQEEIDKILIEYARAVGIVADNEEMVRTNSKMREEYGRLLTKVKADLHSKDVVIKKKRELPSLLTTMGGFISPEITQENMVNAGYEATIPLIEKD